MSAWTHEHEMVGRETVFVGECRYTAGIRDRMLYRNCNGDWVVMYRGVAKDSNADVAYRVYRWRWLARLAADWWL